MEKIKIDDKEVFYKVKKEDDGYKQGVATYIQKDSWTKKYNVYRTTIFYSPLKKKWEIGMGWNLFQELDKTKAVEGAKDTLKYL